MTLPNCFIIGAPRCATTTLYEELGRHPAVFRSPIKEPLFFAVEGQPEPFHGPQDNQGIRELDQYVALFAQVRNEPVILEASPMYLSSRRAPRRIKHYVPEAKLVAILRNPVDRAFSHFLFHRALKIESLTHFRAAIAAEEERERCGWSPYWYYRKMGLYSRSLTRYRELFRPDQLKIFLFEELQENPSSMVQAIAEFFGLSDRVQFGTVIKRNFAAVPRSIGFEALITGLGTLPTDSRVLVRLQQKLFSQDTRLKLRRRLLDPLLMRLKRCNRYRPALDPETRRWLIDYYRADILRTQDQLGRDLSCWLSA